MSDALALDELSNIGYESANRSSGSNSHFMNILGVDQLVNAEQLEEPNDENLPPSPSIWTIHNTPGSAINTKSRVKKGFFSGAKKRGFGFHNLSLLGKRQFKQPSSKPLVFNDLTQAIMNGEVSWDDLQFKSEHVKYIQGNKKMLLNSLINQ